MFKSKESLTKAYKKLLDRQIIPIIDKGLSGTVYTQVSDVENEVNGIYTYDRAVLKIDENVLKDINSQLRYWEDIYGGDKQQKLKLLYILKFLQENTDENHIAHAEDIKLYLLNTVLPQSGNQYTAIFQSLLILDMI